MFDGEALGRQLTVVVRDYVARSASLQTERIDTLEKELRQFVSSNPTRTEVESLLRGALAALPVPKDGEPGKDADPSLVKTAVAEAIEELVESRVKPTLSEVIEHLVAQTVAEKVVDTEALVEMVLARVPSPKEIDLAAIADLVTSEVAKIPLPRDGKDADLSTVSKLLKDAIGSVPLPEDGKDGKDADPEEIRRMVAEAVAAIPKPADGKDANPEDIREMVEIEVSKAIAALPPVVVPEVRDGRDGRDVDPDLVKNLVAEAVAAVPKPADGKDADPVLVRTLVETEVAKAISALPPPSEPVVDIGRIENAVAEAIAAIPKPADGKDADPVLVQTLVETEVAKAVAALPSPPEPVVDIGQIKSVVAEMVAAIPRPADGKDADPEKIRELVEIEISKAVAAMPSIPVPENGKDADPEEIRRMVSEAVSKIPPPADGKDADPEQVKGLVRQAIGEIELPDPTPQVLAAVSKAMSDPDLADAIEALIRQKVNLEVKANLPKIDYDQVRSDLSTVVAETIPQPPSVDEISDVLFPRVSDRVLSAIPKPQDGKSFTIEDVRQLLEAEQAKWALEFERRATDTLQRAIDKLPLPKDGRDGFGFDDMEAESDGDGNVKLIWVRGEHRKELAIRLPRFKDQGVFKMGENYREGDGVSWGGSFFIAQKDSPVGKPGESSDWRMAVKRGRDGKDFTPGDDKGSAPPTIRLR